MNSVALIQKYFPHLSEKQLLQFDKLGKLYPEWNEKINIISRKDIDSLYERHILHSLAIAKFTDFRSGTKILDVGTGGGFPGIPLAVLFPDCNFLLVDSIGKKIKVVHEIASAIGLNNLSAQHQRAEKIKWQCDFVVSRAVTRMKAFIPWVEKNVNKQGTNVLDNGIIALKGGDLSLEMNEIKMIHQIKNISDYFGESFFETKQIVYIPL